MNDLSWCSYLRAVAECIQANRIKGALDVANSVSKDNMTDSQLRFIRGTCFMLRLHGDHATYVAEQLRRIDRAIQNHGGDSIYERPRTMMVDLETHTPFANTGRDACEQMVKDFEELVNSTLCLNGVSTRRLTSTQPNLSNLPKQGTTPTMNRTSIELRAELAAAEAAESTAAEIAARQAKLDGYRKLAEATTLLLGRIGDRSTVPSSLLAEHRFKLKALAAEFGFRIVLIGDRTKAVLVQQ